MDIELLRIWLDDENFVNVAINSIDLVDLGLNDSEMRKVVDLANKLVDAISGQE